MFTMTPEEIARALRLGALNAAALQARREGRSGEAEDRAVEDEYLAMREASGKTYRAPVVQGVLEVRDTAGRLVLKLSQDYNGTVVAEKSSSPNASAVCDMWREDGLTEWVDPSDDSFNPVPRHTKSTDPEFLPRLAAYIRRQAGDLIVSLHVGEAARVVRMVVAEDPNCPHMFQKLKVERVIPMAEECLWCGAQRFTRYMASDEEYLWESDRLPKRNPEVNNEPRTDDGTG